ncbi:hypothetical protein [Bacteroides stercorirosoris]|nr:hypothetical protein [Bacteroides stercorirosoris]
MTKVTFSSKGAWSYDPASGKIRIRSAVRPSALMLFAQADM